MDIIFDVDGTLANAEHRLHFITQPADQMRDHVVPDFKKDWDSFLSDEEVFKDTPIVETWELLNNMFMMDPYHRLIFITGRPERTRQITLCWLGKQMIDLDYIRSGTALGWFKKIPLYMRRDGDRRPSYTVKEELLIQARKDGFTPTLVFEDRADDTAMWRRNGLLCCQVAERKY